MVNFVLILARDDEGDRFGEFEARTCVESGEFLAIERERDRHDGAFRAKATFSVASDSADFRIREDGAVEIGRFFGLRVEPEKGIDFWHGKGLLQKLGLSGNTVALKMRVAVEMVGPAAQEKRFQDRGHRDKRHRERGEEKNQEIARKKSPIQRGEIV